MKRLRRKIERMRWWLRWPTETAIVLLTGLAVAYPYPNVLWRQIVHLCRIDQLPDPHEPALAAVNDQWDRYLQSQDVAPRGPADLVRTVEPFVYAAVPYAWDWDVWGVADYTPTVAEVITQGREDCDGRAVLAAALLRSRGIEAKLVGGNGHVWVWTPYGETMSPIGQAATLAEDGVFACLLSFFNARTIAFGVAVFPWQREAVFVAILCWVLWGTRASRRWTAVMFLLLIGGWWALRLGGGDVRDPIYGLIYPGVAMILAAWAMSLWGENWKRYRPVGIAFLENKRSSDMESGAVMCPQAAALNKMPSSEK